VPWLQAGGLVAPCALVAALFAVTAALLQLAAHLPAAAAAGGTDGAATLVRDSVVEGAAGAAGKGGVACVQSTDVPRAHRGESGDGGSAAPLKITEVGRSTRTP
jgi:hypothetical protein